jgi:hypothetical protein
LCAGRQAELRAIDAKIGFGIVVPERRHRGDSRPGPAVRRDLVGIAQIGRTIAAHRRLRIGDHVAGTIGHDMRMAARRSLRDLAADRLVIDVTRSFDLLCVGTESAK